MPRMVEGVSRRRCGVRPRFNERRELPDGVRTGSLRTRRANAARVLNANRSVRLRHGPDGVLGLERHLGGRRRGGDEAGRRGSRLDRGRRCSRCSRRRLNDGRRRGLRLRSGSLGAWHRRQERQRVDVALILVCETKAEIDEGLGQVGDAARADRPDDRGLRHMRAVLDADRAEVKERRGVAGRSFDRNGLAAARHGACEGHDALGRGADVRARGCTEVDSAVLSRCIRVRAVERERPKNLAVDRPGPGPCGGRRHDERAEREDSDSTKHDASLLSVLRTERR
jgi:hypothetical protein